MTTRVGGGVAALRGAVGFLTRIPVGRDRESWEAFRTTPATFPLAGYLAGALVAVPFALPALAAAGPAPGGLPAPTAAFAYVVAVYAVTGINHLDGVADLGDAAVVHGDAERRRDAMKDTTVGVGAVLAVALVLAGLGLGGLALAGLPVAAAVAVVVAAEVGAKAGMAAVACFGTATHEGLGSALTGPASPQSFALPAAVAVPSAALAWPSLAAAAALAGAGLATAVLVRRARTALGGVGGDVFGAVNEVGRVAGLHAGVIAWTLS
ncbi:adenosylcobinamide-GDP ribazoletransferase [Halostella sp. JP-L12]|nr:adenosylcobinamide-GDP ribazoletransferase [Halostella sp. JP-L12]